jgi:hypothetical protein
MPAVITRPERAQPGDDGGFRWASAQARRRRPWLRLVAAFNVLILAVGIRYDIATNPPVYTEGATVVFSLPESEAARPNAYLIFAPSLIATSEAMTQILLGPEAQRQIRTAGGTATVSIALVNLYDEEYPNYGVPLANLTISSRHAASVRPTFTIVVRLLRHLLAARQARLSVQPQNRISAQIIGDSGLIVQHGSPRRVLAGIIVLALIAYSALCGPLSRPGTGRRTSRHGQPPNWPGRAALSGLAARALPGPDMLRASAPAISRPAGRPPP